MSGISKYWIILSILSYLKKDKNQIFIKIKNRVLLNITRISQSIFMRKL